MRSPKKTWSIVAFVGVSLFILSLLLAFAVFPYFVEQSVTKTVILEEGSDTWDRWKVLPIPILLKLYVFNVTNPEAVMMGAKPIVKEIGPYVYKQFRHKEGVKLNKEDDEVTYEPHLNHQFDPEESGDLTENDQLVVLNPALMGMMNLLENIPVMSRLVKMLQELAPIMFPGAIGVFLKTTPAELFFKGVRIQCQDPRDSDQRTSLSLTSLRSTRKISLLAMCSSLKRINVPTITEREDKDINFSIFGHKNRTSEGVFTINTGMKDPSKLGLISTWNGKHFVDAWGGPTCNAINGTAGDIFRPFITKDSKITVFSPDICRSMTMEYFSTTSYQGIPGLRFRLARNVFTDPRGNADNYCFCPQKAKKLTVENACLRTGALDVSGCQGVPVIISYPHFLLADDFFKNGVDGLNADPDKHEMTLDIEPYTGAPLRGGKKMQLNIHMKRIKGVSFTDNLRNTLMPVLWMDEGAELNDELVSLISDQLVKNLTILDATAYSIMSLGLLLVLVSGGMVWRAKRQQNNSRVRPERSSVFGYTARATPDD